MTSSIRFLNLIKETHRKGRRLLRPASNHPHTSKVDTESDVASSMRVSVLSRSFPMRQLPLVLLLLPPPITLLSATAIMGVYTVADSDTVNIGCESAASLPFSSVGVLILTQFLSHSVTLRISSEFYWV
jgi:hypothetical protein